MLSSGGQQFSRIKKKGAEMKRFVGEIETSLSIPSDTENLSNAGRCAQENCWFGDTSKSAAIRKSAVI